MNKKLIIGAVAAILIGAGVYVATRDSGKTTSNSGTTEQTSTNTVNQTTAQSQSIDTLRASGKPQKCNFSYTGASGKANAVMYTDGQGKSRIDMTSITDQNNSGNLTQIIRDGKSYSIVESNGKKLAFAFDLEKLKQQTNSSTTTTSSSNQGIPTDSNFEMSCTSWSVESSLFEVPGDATMMSL
jgi:hypothetical protein